MWFMLMKSTIQSTYYLGLQHSITTAILQRVYCVRVQYITTGEE